MICLLLTRWECKKEESSVPVAIRLRRHWCRVASRALQVWQATVTIMVKSSKYGEISGASFPFALWVEYLLVTWLSEGDVVQMAPKQLARYKEQLAMNQTRAPR